MIRAWDDIPEFMRCDEIREYYDVLYARRGQLAAKRLFDLIAAMILLILLAIPMIIIAIGIKVDSPGKVIFRQERVTSFGKRFRIHKFRTMTDLISDTGSLVTVSGDPRITMIGKMLRDHRLDELPQLFDILSGNMSFVGTRPEVPRYVEQYEKEMYATLLLPAGLTSEASIRFKDESQMLSDAKDVDRVYVESVLPQKMKYNLDSIRHFNLLSEAGTMLKTIKEVFVK